MRHILDIECSIVESNELSGVNERTIRWVVNNVTNGFTEVDESKQDMHLPVQFYEFSYIRCRLLDHMTKTLIQYRYDYAVGRPYIIVRISPVEK